MWKRCGDGHPTRPPDTRTPERAVITRLLPPYSPLALASTHIHNCADNAGPVPTTTTPPPLSLSVSRQHPSTPRSSLLSVYYGHNCRFHAYANWSPSLSHSLSLCPVRVVSVCMCTHCPWLAHHRLSLLPVVLALSLATPSLST